jgi:hypothetical protein
LSIFLKLDKKFYFIVRETSCTIDYLFKDPTPEEDGGGGYFFSDVIGGKRKEGAAIFPKAEAKDIIKYLKKKGYSTVQMKQQTGLIVKDGAPFEHHNKGGTNYNDKGKYIH